jgi:hypothetical protein
MRRFVVLSAVLAVLLVGILHASIFQLPSGQSVFSCTALFTNSVNGKPLVSPAIATYSSYTGLISVALLVVMAMFMVMAVIYALGIAFRWDMLMNFAKREYLEGFVTILIILFIAAGIAAFSGAESSIGSIFSTTSGTTVPGTFQTLYTSLCNNIFSKMVVPGFLMVLWTDVNKLMISLISNFKIEFAPGGMGIVVNPFAGFSSLNQLIWVESGIATFMVVGGGLIIMLLFVIYYLFPIFLFLGVALRAFPWTRAAGGAFIALFIAFYVLFPAIMYPFTVSYSSTNNPSSISAAICKSGTSTCPSGIGLALDSFTQYLGVINLDIGYSEYTNLLYFSQLFIYIVLDFMGLVIALLISYDTVTIFGKLLGSNSVSGSGIMGKILKGSK